MRLSINRCLAIKFLFEKMSLRWLLDHQFQFLKALLFVMMDLSGEVSSQSAALLHFKQT